MSKVQRSPIVSSLSMAFKKNIQTNDDVAEVKREHRATLKNLMDKYIEDVNSGLVDGIRNAKDLIEVIKTDLLLLGEATERKEDISALEEVRIQRIQQALEEDNPNVQSIIESVLMAINDANDSADTSRSVVEHTVVQVEQPDLLAGLDDDVKGGEGSE